MDDDVLPFRYAAFLLSGTSDQDHFLRFLLTPLQLTSSIRPRRLDFLAASWLLKNLRTCLHRYYLHFTLNLAILELLMLPELTKCILTCCIFSLSFTAMRVLLSILASILLLSSMAQTPLPLGNMNYGSSFSYPINQIMLGSGGNINQKWYLSSYAGLSTGQIFGRGAAVSLFSFPIGLQLNRPLNNNLMAFAGISTAPTVFTFSSFMHPGLNNAYPGPGFSNGYGINLHTSLQMGLMYVNDARTFSISGSIGVHRYSYPVYPSDRTKADPYQRK